MGTSTRTESEICSCDSSAENIDLGLICAKHFLPNKYTKWYLSIIDKAKQRTVKPTITERHHILPKGKYMFPEYSSLKLFPWNGVDLSLREHFICHRLLVKMTKGKAKLSCAYGLRRLSMIKSKFSSRQYEIAKIEYSTQRKMNSSTLKGRPGRKWTDEDRQKHSERMIKRMADPLIRETISRSKAGRPGPSHTDESKLKIGISNSKPSIAKSISKSGSNNPAFGKRWFNDGIVSKQFHPGTQPSTWNTGKVKQ